MGGSFNVILTRLGGIHDVKNRYLRRAKRDSFIIPKIEKIRILLESKIFDSTKRMKIDRYLQWKNRLSKLHLSPIPFRRNKGLYKLEEIGAVNHSLWD